MKLTPMQIIGIILVVNGALIGATAQLTDAFGPQVVKYIVLFASLGNSIFGGIITMLSTQGSMVKSVLAMPGVEKIDVNGQASSALATLAVDPAQNKIGPTPAAMATVTATAKAAAVILFAIMIVGSTLIQPAFAQGKTRPRLPIDPLGLNDQTIAGTTAAPAKPVVIKCDFNVFVNLRPENLDTFVKTCVDDVNSTLADDTARALQSAENYQPNPDQDAISCLKPGLAIIQAGITVPAVPAQDAIPATATTPAVPAVAAVPAKSPGLILLFQKYREFTLAGALTACQAWINGPINATVAAGVGGAGALVGAAAVLVPK